MNGTSTLPEQRKLQKENLTPDSHNLDLSDLAKSASRVIAPLWPIATFAARNPWMGLENQSFEQVARWLKDTRDVEIYPSSSVIHAAQNQGEIDEDLLEIGLQRWLDLQSIDLPREEAERYCRAALSLDELPSDLLVASEIKRVAEKLSEQELQTTEKHSQQTLSLLLEQQGGERVAHALDHHLIKWCKLFLDESQAAWSLPNREKGFYGAWRRLVPYDPALTHTQRKRLKDWPQEANFALKEALSALEIPQSKIQDYLEAHLLSLPGWAGMMLWRSQQSSQESSLLIEYLAVRISLEWVLIKPHFPLPEKKVKNKETLVPLIAAWTHWGDLPIESWSQLSSTEQRARLDLAYRFDEIVRRKIWLEAWEQTYSDQLSEIVQSKKIETEEVEPTLAQFTFCIDVRSEPFRRQLEKAGPFETYGMAGFFGLPIEISELGSGHTHPSLPVILKPQQKVKEFSPEFEFKQYQQRRQGANSLSYTFKTMKQNLLTSLLLPEVSGPWLSLQMLARSFVPRSTGRAFRKFREAWLRKPSTELSLDHTHTLETELPVGFSEEEKANYVRQALKLMGLTSDFAPLVVICGHGSHSTNNPYAASLDCGACGGASGGFNARVLATLCNLPKVREILATEGILIPEDTVFAAAEHVTTLDELHWLYVPELSETAQEAFDRIQSTMQKVSQDANEARLSQLPNLNSRSKNPKSEAQRLAEDWSEVRPEWGLAGNAAFVVGRRELTKECNLGGRVFLHNYDWQDDEDGAMLANIIAGPGTVSQWINLQYYASTVAPHYYGSGNKATQTVTAGLGVMQGNASDLLAGLPWQSVMQSDQEVYHAPLRLLVVIEAPREYVERLLNHDPALRQKVQNGWLRLATIDPEGYWENWSNEII
ncbi:Na-translocating system protein MpsB [Aquibacillus sp. 3ASR75-11]|uniref:Probable inorganic carbon transporter subunit DabA n=2 Tax=Terrihalobacillus insolitus TaxID=2950438 RepID=A0A9X3WTG8_9BACI|nr:putative inorganic carbon transporter subunit DabA [Terrihalobacillus insolitus]MDC3423119.1 Na-translocating system protein MpsB [Terrihalobacillus insolitus]